MEAQLCVEDGDERKPIEGLLTCREDLVTAGKATGRIMVSPV